jgi:hypothetical protein
MSMTETHPVLSKGKRITGEERDTVSALICRQYENGQSIRQIAASTGRSYGFVHGVLRESGAALRGRGGTRARSR